MLKICLSNGKDLTCTKYHRFSVKINRGENMTYERKIKEAQELSLGDYIEDYYLPFM